MKRIIPVIHVINIDQVKQNIDVCLENDINHVFLINHNMTYSQLLEIAIIVRYTYPKLWIGLNMLDAEPSFGLSEMIIESININALWFDQTLSLNDVIDKKFTGEIFSGLNFKYQKQVYGEDLIDTINIIKQTSSVACTSGKGTGKEAYIHKIKLLKELLGDFPLALASGVSKDNIQTYLPYVDNFLVASSITNKEELIEKHLLKELIETFNLK